MLVIAQANAALAPKFDQESPTEAAERLVHQNRSQHQPDWVRAVQSETYAKMRLDQLQEKFDKLPRAARLLAKLTGGAIGGKAAQIRHQLADAQQGLDRCTKRRSALDNQWTDGGLKKQVVDGIVEKKWAEEHEKQQEEERRRDEARRVLARTQAALVLCKSAAQIGALGGQRNDRTPVCVSIPSSAGNDPRAAERAAAQVQAALARKMAEAKAKAERERSLVEDTDEDPEIKRRKARMRPGRGGKR